MSELRPLTHGQYGNDDVHNSAQGTVKNNEDPKTNREPTSNLLQDSTQQLATSPSPPSPSPKSVSAGPQGAHYHRTSLQSTHHASLQEEGEIGGRTIHLLRMELEKEKKLKAEAESELAAALRRKKAVLREKAALEEERKKFSAVMSRHEKEGNTLRKNLRPDGGSE
ncbi:hypothetical protein TrVE_jg1489 [Triparma verrucosa]|uniref:Uncharacterized protein n=1 Tax=Triparma verrucosa TaxID=1606542 RepID=A0A9W7EXR1_9STRA|nr:hypothetical protein TrVE_jg1489 [Triparma verrucosa]